MSPLDLRAARRVLATGLPFVVLGLVVLPVVLKGWVPTDGAPLRGCFGIAVAPLVAVVLRAIWVAYAPFLTATVTNPRRTHLYRVGEAGLDWWLMGSVVAGPLLIPFVARGRLGPALLLTAVYGASLIATLEMLRRRMLPASTGGLRWFDQRLENYRVLRTGLLIGTLAVLWIGGAALAFDGRADAAFLGYWFGMGCAVIALFGYWPFFLVWVFEDLTAAIGLKLVGLGAGAGLLIPAYQGDSRPLDAAIGAGCAAAFVAVMELLRRRAFHARAVELADGEHAESLLATYGTHVSRADLDAHAARTQAAPPPVQIATADALARAQHIVVLLGLAGVCLCVIGAFGPAAAGSRLFWAGQVIAVLGGALWIAAIQRFKSRGLVVEADALVFRIGHEERRIGRADAHFGVERRRNALQVTVTDGQTPPVAVPGLVLRSPGRPTTITLRNRSDLLGWTDTDTQWNGDPGLLASIIAWAETHAPLPEPVVARAIDG